MSDAAPPQRLQKILAAAGHGSRRACEKLIAQGRVTIDGDEAVLGDRADIHTQRVAVDGVAVRVPETTTVYLLNKPAGVVTTADDPQGRPKVVDLVPPEPRVFAVGRLDRDTEGLLLLTNDGDLAQAVAHPSHELEKTYVATVKGQVGDKALRRLRKGVELDDGPARAVSARVLAASASTALVEIKITMGRKRVVRRMLAAVGAPVERLVRTAIGPLRDPGLEPGDWRILSTTEIAKLERAATENVQS